MNILESIKEKINEADMVLLGIGEELQIREEDVIEKSPVYLAFAEELKCLKEAENNFIKDSLYVYELEKQKQTALSERLQTYHKLWGFLKDKNYFIVTICRDDLIYLSEFDSGRVVSPCGTRKLMKCGQGCSSEVLETEEVFLQLNHKLKQMYKEGGFVYDRIEQDIPKCRECGACMDMDFVGTAGYSEKGYEKNWKRYMMWLQGTLNKKICILELGAGFSYPTVIRWPFEKVAMLNNKACFVRVNEKLPQTAKEIKEKSFSVEMNSVAFIEKITE